MQLYSENKENQTLENKPDIPVTNKRGFVPVLKNKRFLALWSGQIFSQLADKVYLVLMIAIIASNFQEDNQSISGWVSAIMIAFTIPAILFGSLAGVFVDRWPKKEVLVISNLIRGFLVLSLPLILSFTNNFKNEIFALPIGFWAILIVTFFVSTLTQFFAPAEQSTIPLIVKHEYLLAANSLYTTTMVLLLVIGFAIGEPLLGLADQLISNLGLSWNFGKELLVGGSYALAGIILLILKTGEKHSHLAAESPHIFADIWEGLVYLKENHKVRNALFQLVILFSVFAALAVLAVRLAEIIPGMRAEQFGFLLASAGVGMGISAAILGHWGSKFSHIQLSLAGSIGLALSLSGLALFTHSLALELLMTGLLGAFGALIGVPMQTTIQGETPPVMRGKVFGIQNNAVNIALSLPLALAGLAETQFGLQPVLFSLSILAVFGGILNWLLQLTINN